MKKFVTSVVVILLIVTLGFTYFLKFPPWQIGNAIQVASGLGAKLACSGQYVSGFSKQRVVQDLASYSPATNLLEFTYDHTQQSVTASMFGLSTSTAQYREGIGCTLEYGDTTALDNVNVPELVAPEQLSTATLKPDIQTLVDSLLVQDNAAGLDSRAIVVLQNGELVAEAYGPGIDVDTPLLGWSMAKTITAMLVGNLVYQGKIATTDSALFDAWDQDGRKDISLRNLLTMTSGLKFAEPYTPGSDSTEMLFLSRSAASIPLNQPLTHIPGEHNSYSSGTSNILSKLSFNILGESTQQQYTHLYETLIKPLSLTSMVFESDASGVFIGSSYVYASGRDWAKLGQVLVNGGEYNNQRLLAEPYTTAMFLPNTSDNEPRYGYQLWLNSGGETLRWDKLPLDAGAMMGNRSQIVLMIPSRNIVIVRLGWTTGGYNVNEKFFPLVEALH